MTVTIRTNGKPDAAIQMRFSGTLAIDEPTQVLIPVFALAQVPNARKAAVIGFGSGMSTAILLSSPASERVDTVEIEPMMLLGAQHFRPHVNRAFDDPRSRIVIDDAKSYFSRGRLRYDLIMSEPSNPWVAGVSSLFTEEFYSRIAGHLVDDGVFAQWIQLYEFDDALLASIVAALGTAFDDYAVYMATSTDVVVVARKQGRVGRVSPRIFQYPSLAEQLQRIGMRGAGDLEERRVADRISARLSFWESARPNSDYFPILDSGAPKARFKKKIAYGILQIARHSGAQQ